MLVVLEPVSSGVPLPRAFLRVGGASIARHQLAQALALECQRIICLARGISADLIDMQHVAEQAGVAFHVVSGPRALVGQITAQDEVIVFGDGLLANGKFLRELAASGSFVLVQPIEAGLEAGFERIDLNHATAGLTRIPGRLIERLAELPSDCDAASALTRIALQAGVPVRQLPDGARERGGWRIVHDEIEAQSCESDWIARHLATERASGPGVWLSRGGVAMLGPALLHGGHGSRTVLIAVMAVIALALAAGWMSFTPAGFLLVGVAWLLARGMDILERIEDVGASGMPGRRHDGAWLDWLIDVVIVILAVWHAPTAEWESWLGRAFPPLAFIGTLRFVGQAFDGWRAGWLQDRSLLCLLLALCAMTDFLSDALAVLCLILLGAGIVATGYRSRITSP